MGNLKILYLTPGCFDKGGISRYNRYQISALREILGQENIKAFSLLSPQEGDFEEGFDIAWHAWGNTISSKLFFIFKVLRTVHLWKPDVIWLGHVNLTEILVRFNLFKKAKSVLNVYGLEVWSGLRPKVEIGFKKVDYVISDCHFTAKYIEEVGFRKSNSTEVIWDCVDLDKFSPISEHEQDDFYKNYHLPNPEDNPWILTLGRLSFTAAHKGYERLIEVFSNIAQKDDNSVLVFAGKGDMVDYLRELSEKFNVSHRVFFSGMVHENDLPKFYRAARVFSLVSDRGKGRGEGIPLTPLEAMACGAPIIVGNQDGSQEAIVDSQNGYCIDSLDIVAHTNAILEILNSNEKYEVLSQKAIEIAQTYFSYDGFKGKHQAFIDTVI